MAVVNDICIGVNVEVEVALYFLRSCDFLKQFLIQTFLLQWMTAKSRAGYLLLGKKI